MRRFLRRLFGVLLLLLAVATVGGKLWLDYDGPYLEALAPYPYCEEARAALGANEYQDALELAEVGDCAEELAAAEAQWGKVSAVVGRCVSGIWTGRAGDGAGMTCAIVSDLVVFGDVRDLTRQAVAGIRGEATDPVLIALSAAGLALTFTPQLGAGTSVLKGARRAGALSEPLTKSVVRLAEERAWRPLAGLLGDAGRLSVKLGPARATKVLAYADDADDLAALAKFAESAPSPLLGLKWGGKRVAALTEDALYAQALKRGPAGIELALERGGKALLARHPGIVFVAKTLYKNPEAVLAAILAIVAFLLRWFSWQFVAWLAGGLALVGLLLYASGRRRPRRRRRTASGRSPA